MLDLDKARAICAAAKLEDLNEFSFIYYGRDNAIFFDFCRTALPEALDEIERLRKGHEALNYAMGSAADETVSMYERLNRVVLGSKETTRKLALVEKENQELRETVKLSFAVQQGHVIDELRKRLELAEAVCEVADTHVHYGFCSSNVGCNCENKPLRPSVLAWRAAAKREGP